ncbi:MAG: tetratricopeptide repeat protein [Proteobacteria bacterium]|nr:tetratricopeptide repeat protein [Pseudomonadota bacterium]MBU4389375.1 tetratricopeptide repeat protein [Pseudomonadota bacterium]MBU4503926.1 tetratricopeptide repeat protein [Pseudomonadota bacterium]MCG2830260.1 tetratricopeptide repeat protein [Desulfobacteraceae bacterium]
MKSRLLQLSIFLFIAFLFYPGCNLIKSIAPDDELPVKKTENRYYNYIEAYLNIKKNNLDKAIYHLNKTIKDDPENLYLQRELALLYLLQKDSLTALNIVENIIDKNPRDIDSLIMYGRIKQSLKQIDDAKEAYENVIAFDPSQKEIYLVLGDIYMAEGKLGKALKIYKQLVNKYPEFYAGHFFIGKIYAEQDKIVDAEIEFNKALDLEPGLEEARFELIKLYKSLGEDQKVINIYKEILRRNSNNIRAALELGLLYYKDGMIKDSDKLLEDLAAKSLSDSEVIRKVAELYLDEKKYDDAVIILEGMLKNSSYSSDLHYAAGIAYDGIKDKEMTTTHLKQVKPGSKFYQNAAIRISLLYRDEGKIGEAINFLENVIENIPDKPEPMLYLGSFYEEKEEFNKAEKVFKKALIIDPKNIELHFRLGVVYDKLDKKEAAIESMKTVINLDPHNANALNYVGYIYAELGINLDEAERLIKEALKYSPDDGYITDSLGWVYYKKGLYKDALKLLKKAADLVPDDPTIFEHLGDAYLKMNDKKKALMFYERSLLKREKDKADIEKKILELK